MKLLVPIALAVFVGACAGAPSPSSNPPVNTVTTNAPSTPPIVKAGASVLRSRAKEVPAGTIATPLFQDLLKTMVATMRQAPG